MSADNSPDTPDIPTEPTPHTPDPFINLPGWDSPLSTLNGGPGIVYIRLAALKRAVRPLDKMGTFRGTAKSGKQITYKFRGVDDIYNHVHDLMGRAGLTLVPETTEVQRTAYQGTGGGRANHTAVVVTYRWYAEDGSSIPVQIPGEGMDAGDKGTGKALSMAHKYAIIQSLALPTGEPDADDFQTEGTPVVRPASERVDPDQASHQAPPRRPAAPRSVDRPAWDTATGPARNPYPTEDEATLAVEKATPDTRQEVQRRIMDTVAAGIINGGTANLMMGRLKENTG